jgi:hypothetical protein
MLRMKGNPLYRILTIALGIIVAVLVVVALWMADASGDNPAARTHGVTPGVSLLQSLVDRTVSPSPFEVRF